MVLGALPLLVKLCGFPCFWECHPPQLTFLIWFVLPRLALFLPTFANFFMALGRRLSCWNIRIFLLGAPPCSTYMFYTIGSATFGNVGEYLAFFLKYICSCLLLLSILDWKYVVSYPFSLLEICIFRFFFSSLLPGFFFLNVAGVQSRQKRCAKCDAIFRGPSSRYRSFGNVRVFSKFQVPNSIDFGGFTPQVYSKKTARGLEVNLKPCVRNVDDEISSSKCW